MTLIIVLIALFVSATLMISLVLWADVKQQFKINPVNFYATMMVNGKRVRGYVKRLQGGRHYIFVSNDGHYYKEHHDNLRPLFNFRKLFGFKSK